MDIYIQYNKTGKYLFARLLFRKRYLFLCARDIWKNHLLHPIHHFVLQRIYQGADIEAESREIQLWEHF